MIRKILLLLASFLPLTITRFMSGSVLVSTLQTEKHVYLAKFAMNIGTSSLDIRFKFSKPIKSGADLVHLDLGEFIDPFWDAFLAETDCQKKLDLAQHVDWEAVPLNGSWGELYNQVFGNIVRTHVWFFELFDCSGILAKIDPDVEILWEAKILNADGSHFSEEEKGVLTLKLWLVAIIIIFFIFNFTKFYKFYKTEEIFDYPGLCLILVLFIEFWSLIFDVIHLSIFANDGVGSYFFNFSSVALTVISQYSLTCLLLLLASGWSFKYMSLDQIKNYSPGAVLLGIIQIFLMWLGTASDDEHDKFDDFENWSGFVIILIRVACYGFFLNLLRHIYDISEEEDKKFLKLFGFLGTIYFLAFPILVLISSVFVAPYLRHKVIIIGSEFFLITTMMFLTKMFTNKKNKFYNNLLDVQKMLEVEIRDNKIMTELSV